MSKLKENNFNCKYVPNFIKTKDYKSRVRGHLRPKILWVRAFHKMYNPTMAIETINILKNKYPEINLCMVGPDKDGSLKDCKNIANEYDITKNIKYTGYLSKNDWHELSNEYDIFINTTNFESFGLSLIEASALGLPLISTNAGEIKYIYKNNINAMLVDKNDSRAMASQIDKLIENKDLARYLSEHNIKRSKKYNWESIKDNWIKYIPK
jgi:glycosyltransferase involved in cell wall biosynthesis